MGKSSLCKLLATSIVGNLETLIKAEAAITKATSNRQCNIWRASDIIIGMYNTKKREQLDEYEKRKHQLIAVVQFFFNNDNKNNDIINIFIIIINNNNNNNNNTNEINKTKIYKQEKKYDKMS